MAIRNFIQQGQAYGTTPCAVVVTLDGVEIYSGSVPTVAGPLPPQPGTNIDETAFTFTLPADFSGSKQLAIQVSGSTFVIADTQADRSSNADTASFDLLLYDQIVDGVTVIDPYTNVAINGVSKSRTNERTGQWYWKVGNGQTLTATLNVPAGVTYPDWDPTTAYVGGAVVVYSGKVYKVADTGASAGQVPSANPQTWFTYPVAVWNVNTSYVMYDRVLDNGNVYMALQAVPPGTVTTDTDYWQYRNPA